MLISSADLFASRQPEVSAVSPCLVFTPSPRIYIYILFQNNIISERFKIIGKPIRCKICDDVILDYAQPEDGDGIQPPKRRVLKYKEGGVLDKNRMIDYVQKHNICIDVPSSQTFRAY
jgi:hypothetical protein